MNWVCEEGKAGFWQEIRTDKQRQIGIGPIGKVKVLMRE